MDTDLKRLELHREQALVCRECERMGGPVVIGPPVVSKVLLLGQAPGPHEGKIGRPFAWTAGKTLFRWFEKIGLPEGAFRERIYMAAVCRCFPGKSKGGGDRVPTREEVEACSVWLRAEVEILRPTLLIPVGKLAVAQVMEVGRLVDVVGRSHRVKLHGQSMDAIPLPHPSGASTWHRTEPGISLLGRAMALLSQRPELEQAEIPRPSGHARRAPPGGKT